MALIEIRTTPRPFSFTEALTSIRTRLDVWRTRRALAGLDGHQLQDIGVSPAAARREALMTVWNVPSNWARA